MIIAGLVIGAISAGTLLFLPLLPLFLDDK